MKNQPCHYHRKTTNTGCTRQIQVKKDKRLIRMVKISKTNPHLGGKTSTLVDEDGSISLPKTDKQNPKELSLPSY
jgi:hypothetical protein